MISSHLTYNPKIDVSYQEKEKKSDKDQGRSKIDELGELIVELNKLQEYVVAVAEEKISMSTAFYASLSKLQLLTERLKNWKERHGRQLFSGAATRGCGFQELVARPCTRRSSLIRQFRSELISFHPSYGIFITITCAQIHPLAFSTSVINNFPPILSANLQFLND